jgi:hypothetical protein
MAAKKGHIKTGGRTEGTPNKVTTDLREVVKKLLEDNIDTVKADFALLEPKDRITMFEKLLQYAIPKQREDTVIGKDDKSEVINRLFGNGK